MKTFLICLLLPAIALAGYNNCTFYGFASQADDQDFTYTYCSETTGDLTTTGSSTPAKLTALVAGTVGECLALEPDKTDQELLDDLGLATRPLFKGTLDNSTGTWMFYLDQFGDDNCAFIQRRVTMEWGTEFCVEAQATSVGIYNEMMFTDTECGGFGNLTDDERLTIARASYGNVASIPSWDSASIFNPWPTLNAAAQAGGAPKNYAITNNVNTLSFTRNGTFDSSDSLCYGIGDEFAPPYQIPQIYWDNGEYKTKSRMYVPNPPWLCGVSCETLFDGIITAAGADWPTLMVNIANSSCGVAYGAMTDFNTTANPTSFGLSSLGYLVTTLLVHYHTERTCNTCITNIGLTDGPANGIFQIGSVVGVANQNAGSAYYYCQPGQSLRSQLYLRHNDAADEGVTTSDDNVAFGDDPTMCAESTTSSGFALTAGLSLVAAFLTTLF